MTRRVQEPQESLGPHAPDYGLFAIVTVLLVLGLIAVYSSSYALGYAQHGDPNFFIKRQALAALLGLVGLVVAMNVNYQRLRQLSPLLMLAALVTLTAALIPGIGVEQNGAARWISIGPLPPIQPSEFAKLAVLVYMAAWLAAKGDTVRKVAVGVLPFVTMVGTVTALIILEPDLGTAMLIAAVTGTLFFLAGARLIHVIALIGSGAVTTTVLVAAAGYRTERILAFTSPESDPSGLGFQTIQMLTALGSGGITGLGLGVSRQKFFYVPGSHTDGILAILGEELGFIGVMVVLGLFALLLSRGLRIARRAADPFGSLLATGVVAWIAFQTLIHVGGVTHTIPLTGIPLPFMSYGRSSLVMTLTAVGILLSVSRHASLVETQAHSSLGGSVRLPRVRETMNGSSR